MIKSRGFIVAPPHALGLLRARRERPRRSRAAEQSDEVAARHSITSSARLDVQQANSEKLITMVFLGTMIALLSYG